MKANERSQTEFLSRFGIFKRLDCEKMSGEIMPGFRTMTEDVVI